MSTVQRIAKNTSVLLTAQVLSYVLSFFSMMYMARYLGAEGFGVVSFALAFTAIFAVFGDLGLRPLTVREVARNKSLAPKYLANLSLMKIILVTITFGLITLTINLMSYPQDTITVVHLLALSVIFQSFTQMFYSIFEGFERMEFQGIGQMLNAALLLGGVIFAISHHFTVVGFASLYAIASAIVLVYSFAVMKLKFSNPSLASATKMQMDWSFWKGTIKEALPFGLTAIFVTIYHYIDSVMLSLMKGDEVVGWYNAAYRLIVIALLIPIVFNSAIFPVMSRFFISSKAALQFAYERYFKYMVLLSIAIGVGTTLLADRFVLFVFGEEFAPSIIALQILIWSSVFIFIGSPLARLFESLNKQIVITKIVGICAILNVVLNLLFIPKYSYVGASVATALTQLIALALCFIWSLKIGYNIPGRKLGGIFLRVLGASAVMGVFITYFHNLTLLVLIPSAALLYFMVLYIIRGIDKEDIALLREAVRVKQR